MLRLDEQGRFQIAAAWPTPIDPQKSPPWPAAASRRFNELASTRGSLVVPLPRADDLYGQQAGEHALIVPMRHQGQLRGAGVYHLTTGDGRAIEFAGRQLAWGAGLLSMYELKLSLTQRTAALSQLRAAQEVLAEINSHRRYPSAAMAMCNELAGKFAAHRVSVGFLHGRGVKLATMSHTEKFTRKMRIVQLTEAAMEESLDQDLEVIYPTPDATSGGQGETSTTVNRAARELSRQHGPSAIVSLPMRYDGEPFAVLTVEREIEKPWNYAEIAVLRLTRELCTARLVELYERDRWLGARAAKSARKGLAVLVGSRQTWIKLASVGLIAFSLFLIFAKGTYRVEAPFVIEAVRLRSMPAPFQGYIDQVLVKPGDTVKAGQITYLTNKAVTADFLRDQLAMGRCPNLASVLHQAVLGGATINSPTVMRGLAVAIVDEADSVLVDEAVTPLIISGSAPNDEQVRAFGQATQLAAQLEPDRDYQVNQRYREVKLTDRGRDRLTELCADLHGLWAGRRRRDELVTQALSAGQLFHRDQHYIIDEGKIVLVDKFTGRLMPDRTWRAGLHQAVESKEQLDIQPMKDTLALISFQRFFRQYPKPCGMTGTAWEARHEFWQVYRRQVVRIPTHRPCIRQHAPDQVHADAPRKWAAVVERIRRLHGEGRPVLIGARGIKDSEHLSVLLTEAGLQHQVLNAVRHAEEAQIVAQAGQPGAITVATNMAGRGTDIKLGRCVSEAGGWK